MKVPATYSRLSGTLLLNTCTPPLNVLPSCCIALSLDEGVVHCMHETLSPLPHCAVAGRGDLQTYVFVAASSTKASELPHRGSHRKSLLLVRLVAIRYWPEAVKRMSEQGSGMYA